MRIALAVLVCLACSSRAPVALATFPAAYADALCNAQMRCAPQAGYVNDACRGAAIQLGHDVQRAGAAIAYDPAEAAACLDAIANATCVPGGTAQVDESACLRALRGTRAEGAACAGPFECAAGICLGDDAATSCSCPKALQAGEACNAHGGAACDVRQGLVCISGHCTQQQPQGGPCQIDAQCVPGLFCVGGTCAPPHRAGATCSADEACAAGLYCRDTDFICVPRAGAGGLCGASGDTIDAALRGAECAQGLVCAGAGLKQSGEAVSGICSVPGDVGARCSDEADGMQVQVPACVAGLICQGGACAEPPSDGPCAPHEACRRDLAFCDPADGTCKKLRAAGETCAHDFECARSTPSCVQGVCVSLVAACQQP